MNPQKAYRLVRSAIESGTLVRPDSCNRCGQSPPKARDGRSRIHAHHHDYSRPLDVEWICAKCHRDETPLPVVMGAPAFGDSNGMRKRPEARPYGSRNGYAKLDEAAVADIKTRQMNAHEYASKYGISIAAVYDVFQGRRWGWLAAAPEVSR